MTNPLIARLRRLTDLDRRSLDLLEAACGTLESVAAGADVSAPGERLGSYHIVLEGWAARYQILHDGRRQFPALLLPGDVCDLDGLLLRYVHSGVCALIPCTVAVLPHARFRDLVERAPALREAFWWMGSVENAGATEWSVGLGRRSADERLAHLLCELFLRLRTVGLSTEDGYTLPLTQAELADVLGLSTVHINRVLTNLRRRGVIALKDRWLTILDHRALEAAGSFDPGYLHLEGLRLGPGAELRHPAEDAGSVGPPLPGA